MERNQSRVNISAWNARKIGLTRRQITTISHGCMQLENGPVGCQVSVNMMPVRLNNLLLFLLRLLPLLLHNENKIRIKAALAFSSDEAFSMTHSLQPFKWVSIYWSISSNRFTAFAIPLCLIFFFVLFRFVFDCVFFNACRSLTFQLGRSIHYLPGRKWVWRSAAVVRQCHVDLRPAIRTSAGAVRLVILIINCRQTISAIICCWWFTAPSGNTSIFSSNVCNIWQTFVRFFIHLIYFSRGIQPIKDSKEEEKTHLIYNSYQQCCYEWDVRRQAVECDSQIVIRV